jgi:hypothetical protein
MPGGTGCAVARLFQRVSGFLQLLANGPFGRLCTMFHRLACRLCSMFNRLACLSRGFLNGIASFFYWSLVLRSRCERCPKRYNGYHCEMSHSNLRLRSYGGIVAAVFFAINWPAGPPLIWFAQRHSASDIGCQASDQSTLFRSKEAVCSSTRGNIRGDCRALRCSGFYSRS